MSIEIKAFNRVTVSGTILKIREKEIIICSTHKMCTYGITLTDNLKDS